VAGTESASGASGGCGSAVAWAAGEAIGVASSTAADCAAGGSGRGGAASKFGAGDSGAADGNSSCAVGPATVSVVGCLSNKNPEPKNAPVIPTATSVMRTR